MGSMMVEWFLAVHRAVWFPVYWALGLDRPGVDVPLEYPESGDRVVPISRARDQHHAQSR